MDARRRILVTRLRGDDSTKKKKKQRHEREEEEEAGEEVRELTVCPDSMRCFF